MPFQPSDYEMHRALIEQARQRKISARHTKKKQVEGAKKARLKKIPTSALRSEMARRRLAKTPKDKQAAWAAKSAAQRAIAKHYCDHKKKPPKLRKTGKNAGLYVCPSCNKPVPAPTGSGGDLVV